MKKLLFACAVSFCFVQCNSGSSATSGADSNTSAESAKLEPKDTIAEATAPIADSSKEVKIATTFLQKDLRDDLDKDLIDSNSRHFKLAQYDLNGDGKNEIFVALQGMYFCGSGGCTFLLLSNDGKLITRFTVTEYPIRIGNKETNGWKNLVLESRTKFHEMKYNGKSYPSNPSVQPVYADAKNKMKQLFSLESNDAVYTF